MKKIVLFQVENPIQMKAALATMKLRMEVIPVTEFHNTIGSLVSGLNLKNDMFMDTPPRGSLMLMCGLSDQELDQVLIRLRKHKISVTYKAILTEMNQKWTVPELYKEMEKEKALYEQNQRG